MSLSCDERVLQMIAVCPLMSIDLDKNESLTYQAAQSLLRWALMREYLRDPVFPNDLRERFGKFLKELYYKDRAITPDAEDTGYWAGLRKARSVARRVRNFVRRYQILSPVEPYELIITGGATVSGNYATVQARRGQHPPILALVEHQQCPHYHRYQDLLSMARWSHAKSVHKDSQVGLYHLPLLTGDGWIQYPKNSLLVEGWLNSIMTVTNACRYPNPGPHCVRCVDKSCMEVFNGRSPDHSG